MLRSVVGDVQFGADTNLLPSFNGESRSRAEPILHTISWQGPSTEMPARLLGASERGSRRPGASFNLAADSIGMSNFAEQPPKQVERLAAKCRAQARHTGVTWNDPPFRAVPITARSLPRVAMRSRTSPTVIGHRVGGGICNAYPSACDRNCVAGGWTQSRMSSGLGGLEPTGGPEFLTSPRITSANVRYDLRKRGK